MEEQEVMNAYFSRTAIEVFRLEQWQKAIPENVDIGSVEGSDFIYVKLRILKENGYPSFETEVVARDEFALRLRKCLPS